VKLIGPRAAAAAVGFALLTAGCASSGASANGAGAAGIGGETSATATAAGTGDQAPATATTPGTSDQAPATATTMICRTEAAAEIDSALGVKATVSSPTWTDHLYSCTYRYPSGSMQLSVKELSNSTQTDAYYHQLGVQMGDTGAVMNIGQGAFHTTNGSIVVRKDSKVLLVDVTGLPAQFGQPPTTSGNVALTVAEVILACWSGD
jgi:hypothetical protein